MIIIILIAILAVIVSLTVLIIVLQSRKEKEENRMYAAAANILREDFLNYSLQNNFVNNDIPVPSGRKMMIYLKSNSGKHKNRFVFDPEKHVYIGRDKNNSNIYINSVLVSQNHCMIYSREDHVYLADMNSANGTVLKRSLFKKYHLLDGYQIELLTGDRIIIGDCTFKVKLFYFDISRI